MAPLKLYHFPPSPPSRGALLTIRNLGLDVEIKEVNLMAKENLQDWYVKINPQHSVPTLDDDGFILWESRAIATYLANKTASKLYPTEPKKRARVDQRLFFDATTLFVRCRDIVFPVLFLGETTISEEKKNKLYEAFGWLNGFLGESKWVAGDELSIADLSILASISAVIHLGAKLDKFPNLQRWHRDCASLPGFDENDKGAQVLAGAVKGKVTSEF